MNTLVVLVHSPLVGPFTWSLVERSLQASGFDVLVPALIDIGKTPPPYWQQYAESVRQSLASVPEERPLVLVGHSGAGPLLPALAQAAQHPVQVYIFADAGLPHPGRSQLDEMEASVPEIAQELRQLLASGKRFPDWSEEDLSEVIPDTHIRRRMLAELQPRGRDFFEEVMPVVHEWPDAPAGYLLFTEGYRHFLEQAQRAGWPSHTFQAGHFHMLVEPDKVAATIVELIREMN